MAMRLTVRWTPDGSGGFRFRVTNATGPKPPAKAAAGERRTVEMIPRGFELVGGTARRRRGLVVVTQTKGLPTRPSVPWMLSAFAVPAPSTPVGVGATWTAQQQLSRPGQTGHRTRKYNLVGVARGVARVRFEGTDMWRPTTGVSTSALGVHLTSLEERVSGTVELAAGQTLALAGEVTIRTVSTMQMRVEGQSAVKDSVDTITRLTLSPAGGAPSPRRRDPTVPIP